MVTIFVTLIAVIVTAVICIIIFSIKQKKIINSKQKLVSNDEPEIEKDSSLEKSISKYESIINKNLQTIENLTKTVSELQEKYNGECEILQQKDAKLSDTIQQLEKAKIDIQKQNDKINFIADTINAKPVELSAILEFKKILDTDYREFAKDNDSLADEAGALIKLQEVEQQLELLSYDEAIIKKTIVAIAGSYSSGKSSFMNSFLTSRKIILPIGMTQTTAISSYILFDENPSIIGYSYKGGLVPIPDKIFSFFSHDKVSEFNFNMKHLVHSIIFKNKLVHNFQNLCFVDTPGFNAGMEQENDYDSATTSIATASALIWCIDSKAGTINSNEIDILYDIFRKNKKISFYIIANKADLISLEDLENVIYEIESQLNSAEIPYEGISAYSSTYSFTQQPIEFEKLTRGQSLKDFLISKDIENNEKEQLLLQQVKEVFEEYIKADKARINKLEQRIKTLNILEENIQTQFDTKDNLILTYKSKRDTRYKDTIKDDEETETYFFEDLNYIKSDLHNTIKKDKQDIEAADELSYKMQKCIKSIFRHKPDFDSV